MASSTVPQSVVRFPGRRRSAGQRRTLPPESAEPAIGPSIPERTNVRAMPPRPTRSAAGSLRFVLSNLHIMPMGHTIGYFPRLRFGRDAHAGTRQTCPPTRTNRFPRRESLPDAKRQAPEIPLRLRLAGNLLRVLFIGTLLVVIARVSLPQSESIWSAYETPADLIRMALGLAVGVWILLHLFMPPADAEGYRTWIYLGLVVAPFAL